MSQLPSSFRDPSGFVFTRGGELYRQVNRVYQKDYDALRVPGGLYEVLMQRGWLVRHEEVDVAPEQSEPAYRILRPERIPFVSYPYEWCFGQLKRAALHTLSVQQAALERGFTLKDASAYNVQFRGATPVFIDTLSFERYRDGEPWVAYRQFCQHFLAPLALAAQRDIRALNLLRVHLDGVPLELASRLLPIRSWMRFGLLAHLHLHARSQQKYAATAGTSRPVRIPKSRLHDILTSLKNSVLSLRWSRPATEWGAYYAGTNYSDEAAKAKAALLREVAAAVRPRMIWDLGANTGRYTRVAMEWDGNAGNASGVAFDVDPLAVEFNDEECIREGNARLLPLVMDLTNPSPSLGWAGAERDSLASRGPVDLCLALALVHHLAISNNVPLSEIGRYFSTLARQVVIEFVPKSDSQVKRLLASRLDVFPHYTVEGFEAAMAPYFTVTRRSSIVDSERTLYWLRSKSLA